MITYKRLIAISLIILFVDFILIASFIWYNKPTPDISIAELLMVPFIATLNLVIAMTIAFIGRRKMKDLVIIFIVNAFFASLMFHILWGKWYSHYDKNNFIRYSFELQGKQIQLTLDKRDTTYSFSDISDPGSTTEFIYGSYIKLDNVIILTDSSRHFRITNNELIDYPISRDTIKLNKK